MFTAMLLICNVYMPNSCIIAEDSWGPYVTKAECTTRIGVMIGEVKEIAPNMFVKATQCELTVEKGTNT